MSIRLRSIHPNSLSQNQRKLDSEREQGQVAAAAYDGQIRELRSQLEQELRAHHASREGMAEIRLESEKTKMKLEQLEKQVGDKEAVARDAGATSRPEKHSSVGLEQQII